ncbi:MAG TPA: hypothetical protein VKF38_12500 [Anaerolineaceae bacterium]|nr:hypothetical protein [Anaerolineaceae bacterium]
MGSCIILFFVMICSIAWLAEYLTDQNFERQIKQARQAGNAEELQRLNRLRYEREQNKRRAQKASAADQRYFDAIMLMDAAKHGVFVPNPQQYFDRLGQDPADDQDDGYRREDGDFRVDDEDYRGDDADDDFGYDYYDGRGEQYEYPEDY